eukprot:4197482-Pleurochrysis_carterae.AAC.1
MPASNPSCHRSSFATVLASSPCSLLAILPSDELQHGMHCHNACVCQDGCEQRLRDRCLHAFACDSAGQRVPPRRNLNARFLPAAAACTYAKMIC